jgi:hypothetical protein
LKGSDNEFEACVLGDTCTVNTVLLSEKGVLLKVLMAATASWSAAEDKALRDCCAAAPPGPAGYDAIDWDRVAAQVGGRRSGTMCRDRWAALHVPSGKAPRAPKGAAGPWTPEEDAAIVECLHGGMTKVPSVNTHPARLSVP